MNVKVSLRGFVNTDPRSDNSVVESRHDMSYQEE
jgi:hypothetical protein